MPVNVNDPSELTGVNVLGNGEAKLGKVEEVYMDNETNQPEWVSVKTGMFGGNVSLVPLSEAAFDGDKLRVPYDQDQLKDAPQHDPGRDLSPSDEQELYQHYGMSYGQPQQGGDTSGPTTDDAMTRSEEQLQVGTEKVESGRARLRKYIVTENVTQTVPVSREEVRIEREPITDANRGDAMAGGDLTEEEHEVSLTEERVVTNKETVPVERVRLGTETVTGEETVTESVSKEQIETDGTDVDKR